MLAVDGGRHRANLPIVFVAAAFLVVGTAALTVAVSWRQSALFLVGGSLGISLYHALFGFTSAWRIFIADRRGVGLLAQMVMLAIAAILFFPSLGHGTVFGQPVHGEYGAVVLGCLPAPSCLDSECSLEAAAYRERFTVLAAEIRACWSRWPPSLRAQQWEPCICLGGTRNPTLERCR